MVLSPGPNMHLGEPQFYTRSLVSIHCLAPLMGVECGCIQEGRMAGETALERARRDVVRLCHAGLDDLSLKVELRKRLDRVIPHSSFGCWTADPATLLFTSGIVVGTPEDALPAFLANELLEDDVNKFVQLAGSRRTVSTLYEATRGRPAESRRYRDILTPLGFGNELRAVLRAGSSHWGGMCLHRDGTGFTVSEVTFLRCLVPHLAEGLRTALLLNSLDKAGSVSDDSPGLLMLSEDLTTVSVNPAAEHWLEELSDWSPSGDLPQTVRAVALRLIALERTGDDRSEFVPRVRVRSRSGRWVVLHASRLAGPGAVGQIAVIVQLAHPVEVAPLILQAYGLTAREAEVAGLVLRGSSTERVAVELVISPLTVQQHLKAVFEKTGVSSRRELVARVFAEQYGPRVSEGIPVTANGWFASSQG